MLQIMEQSIYIYICMPVFLKHLSVQGLYFVEMKVNYKIWFQLNYYWVMWYQQRRIKRESKEHNGKTNGGPTIQCSLASGRTNRKCLAFVLINSKQQAVRCGQRLQARPGLRPPAKTEGRLVNWNKTNAVSSNDRCPKPQSTGRGFTSASSIITRSECQEKEKGGFCIDLLMVQEIWAKSQSHIGLAACSKGFKGLTNFS